MGVVSMKPHPFMMLYLQSPLFSEVLEITPGNCVPTTMQFLPALQEEIIAKEVELAAVQKDLDNLKEYQVSLKHNNIGCSLLSVLSDV